jgi:hypothetical protein
MNRQYSSIGLVQAPANNALKAKFTSQSQKSRLEHLKGEDDASVG